MKNIKVKILFLLIFALANAGVFYVTELNKEQRVQVVLNDSLKNLKANYELLLHNQKLTADTAYISTTELTRGFTKIMKMANRTSSRKRAKLKSMLYKLLKKKYRLLQKKGVYQFSFYLPNNEAFLRMHKYNKSGDNVTKTRADIRFVNRTQKAIRGFYRGKESKESFRNIYPIFNSAGDHLGAVEISFSGNSLQTYLSTGADAKSYHLVKKDVFDPMQLQKGSVALDYADSVKVKEEELLLSFNKSHTKKECVIANQIKLPKIRKKVDNSIRQSKPFAVQSLEGVDHVEVLAFYPIINKGKNQASGWIVSHGSSSFIFETETSTFVIRTFAFIVFLMMFLAFYKLFAAKVVVEREHRLVNDVLNSSEDIIFATNFKEVTFSNKNFLKYFDVKNQKRFNKKIKRNLLSIFMPAGGSLHSGLLKEKESFVKLVERTPKDKRIVTILDNTLSAKDFRISILKASYSEKNVYLITLSDMVKIQEVETTIQKKAYIDGLTGLYNKNKFDEVIESELKRGTRHKRDLGITLLNIEDLEEINDIHGNLIADAVIMLLAQTIKKQLRETDIFARISDGKFAVAFLDASKEDVAIAYKKLEESVKEFAHPIVGNIAIRFATTQHEESETFKAMCLRCEEMLIPKESIKIEVIEEAPIDKENVKLESLEEASIDKENIKLESLEEAPIDKKNIKLEPLSTE